MKSQTKDSQIGQSVSIVHRGNVRITGGNAVYNLKMNILEFSYLGDVIQEVTVSMNFIVTHCGISGIFKGTYKIVGFNI